MNLSLSDLRAALKYEPKTGVFTRISSGEVAGTLLNAGYRMVSVCGHRIYEHRLAWFISFGSWPENYVDHKNGNRSDNRLSNLRLATNSQNVANQDGHSDSSTGLRGVSRNGKRWSASVMKDRKKFHLGTFDTPTEAHAVYLSAAKLHFGEFARAA